MNSEKKPPEKTLEERLAESDNELRTVLEESAKLRINIAKYWGLPCSLFGQTGNSSSAPSQTADTEFKKN